MKLILPLKLVVITSLVFSIFGCGAHPAVTGKRFMPTNLSAGKSVGIIIDNYEKCDDGRTTDCKVNEKLLTKKKKYIQDCLDHGIRNADKKLTILHNLLSNNTTSMKQSSGETFSERIFPGDSSSSGIDFVVFIRMKTDDGKKHMQFAAAQGGGWAIGEESTRITNMWAEIYDAHNMGKAGELSSTLSGKVGWGVPVLLIIPLPPFIYASDTEAAVCYAMGEAIAKFIAGAGNEYIFKREN